MFASFETDAGIYLVMEYAHTDLNRYWGEQVVKHGGAPLNSVSYLCQQMLAAVAYVHTCGVLHLDVKLANFLVVYSKRERREEGHTFREGSEDGADSVLAAKIKLSDFGLGAVLWEGGAAGASTGKLAPDARRDTDGKPDYATTAESSEWEGRSGCTWSSFEAAANNGDPLVRPGGRGKNAPQRHEDEIRATHVRRYVGNGGTIRYMAPECFFQPDEQPYGPLRLRASMDVWGLGMCLYVLLHNRTPWCDFVSLRRGFTICDPRMVIQFPFPQRFQDLFMEKPQGCSPGVQQLAALNVLLRGMLQRNRTRRWTATQAVARLERLEREPRVAFCGGATETEALSPAGALGA
eukprot:g1857.t1